MKDSKKYGVFDLGNGLILAHCPEYHDALIPNVFVANNQIARLAKPETEDMTVWDKEWDKQKEFLNDICNTLNDADIDEEIAKELVELYDPKTYLNGGE